MELKTLQQLKERYPIHMPVGVAAKLLGMSQRQLSHLVASGREPFANFGANVGLEQKYVRIYTQRLLRYLNGDDMNMKQ